MPAQPMIVGRPALIVVDIQGSPDLPVTAGGIPHMDTSTDERVARWRRVEELVAAARTAGVPVIFFQEVHRRTRVDIGRETDGAEDWHCGEDDPGTDLWPTLRPLPDEVHIVKRRYSGFIGTDFEIVLRGYGVDTLILVGGLTDVCVHYTFADAHQRDYYVRVVTDAVAGSSREAHDASLRAMEYLQTGACRTSDEIMAAFAALTPEVAA